MSSRRETLDTLRAGAPVFREYLTALILHGQAAADAVGLGTTDFYGLNLVAAVGPLTAGELAERTGLTTGAATRLIDRLQRAGYVRREADPNDRRKVLVASVPERTAEFAHLLEPAQRLLGDVFLSYTPGQLAVLFDYFARAAGALREASSSTRDRSRRPPSNPQS